MTSGAPIEILLVEDSLGEARLIQEYLRGSSLNSFRLACVTRLAEAIEQLRASPADVVLLDLSLPDSQGLESLDALLAINTALPIVVLTHTNDEELAVKAVRHGAQDYLVKRQVDSVTLTRSIRYAIERRQVTETLSKRITDTTSKLQKIQSENQMKSDFVSMISHDFRNPLNTILITIDLLQEVVQRGEDQLTYIRAIRSSIESLTALLDEVSLLNRSHAGQLICQCEPLDLHQFCAQVIDELSLGIPEENELSYTHSGEFHNGLWDKNMLWHILMNLLTNAIKYSPQGGLVHLHVENLDTSVRFHISDQGIGIAASEIEHLFHPFFRGSNIGTLPGSGLGLAIVQRCVRSCDGSCSVTSKLGEGTTVTVEIPLSSDHCRLE